MKIALALPLASFALAGSAFAADGLRIESEDQFVRDNADRIDRHAPGVYQIVRGPLAGKTLSIGETGLAYDLAVLRAEVPSSTRERAQLKQRIGQLERIQSRFALLATRQDGQARKSTSGSFHCYYDDWRTNRTIFYTGYASVSATTEYYMDNGGGGLNPYYARASATANGWVSRPAGVPTSVSVSAVAYAKNHHTGQTVSRPVIGVTSAGTSTGYVYSGPDFSHHLDATGTVSGVGDCFGYVSISDTLQ